MEDYKILNEAGDKLQPISENMDDWRAFQRAQQSLPHAAEFAKKQLEESQHNVLKELGKA